MSAGSDKTFFTNDTLSTITLKYDREMDLQPVIKVFDAEYIHSHTAVVCNLDEHGGIGDNVNLHASGKQGGPNHNGILQVTNLSFCYNDTWVPIVHVQGGKSSNLSGFYLWIQGPWGWDGTLIPHAHTPEELLTIIDTICLHVVSVCPDKRGVASEQEYDPSLVYDNYCKDSRSWQYYGCSYEDYMLAIIDTMINVVEQPTCEVEPLGSGTDIGSHDIEQTSLNKSSDVVIPSLQHTYDDIPLAPQTTVEFSYDSSSQDRDIPRPI